MFKKVGLIIVLASALVLAGCVTLEIHNDIHPDGRGFKILIVGMDQEALQSLQEMSGTPEPEQADLFADTCEQAKEIPGAKCEPYQEDNISGVKITAPFANLDELAALSDYELFSADEISYEQNGSVFTIHFTVKTGEVSEELASESGGMEGMESDEEMEEMARQMLELMDIKLLYRATVPGRILAYTPQDNATVEQNTITWEVDLLSEESSQEFTVQYDTSQPPGPPAQGTPPPAVGETATPEDEETPAPPPTRGPQSSEETGGLDLSGLPCSCPCLPGLILPLGAVGSILIWGRRKSPLG
ncbi:MAG: hypothetical protein H5T62_15360 [Anaerolineae bacterium]|nr:hypothetical protein [Anaerolineae bacterium]